MTAVLLSLCFHAGLVHRDEMSVGGGMIDTSGAGGSGTAWSREHAAPRDDRGGIWWTNRWWNKAFERKLFLFLPQGFIIYFFLIFKFLCFHWGQKQSWTGTETWRTAGIFHLFFYFQHFSKHFPKLWKVAQPNRALPVCTSLTTLFDFIHIHSLLHHILLIAE